MKAIKLLNSAKICGKLRKSKEVLLIGKGKDIDLKEAEYLVEHGAAEDTVEPSAQTLPKDELSVEEMAVLEDLSVLKDTELKKVCKHFGLEKYSSLNKAGLIKLIDEHRNGINIDEMNEDELRALAEKEGIDIPDEMGIESIRDLIAAELGE